MKVNSLCKQETPQSSKNYPITELELHGLAINIVSFSHLLKRVDFNVIVDHLALTYIIKSKAEPATTRIKTLLKLISSYSFISNIYRRICYSLTFCLNRNMTKVTRMKSSIYLSIYLMCCMQNTIT